MSAPELAPPPERVRIGRAFDISMIVVCQAMGSLSAAGLALFLPLIRRDVDLSFTQAGTLATVTTLVYAAMQVPTGFLSDRFGAKRLFVIGVFGASALALMFATLHTYGAMLLNQAASGLFRAFLFSPGMTLITAQFPPKRRATAMGLFVAGGFGSNIFLNLLGPFFVASVGWRTLFVGLSFFAAALIAIYWARGERGPAPNGEQIKLSELGGLIQHPVMWLCCAVQFVRLAVVHSLQFWLPSLLVEERGLTIATAGTVMAVSAALTAPSNFFGGYIADRLEKPITVVATSLAFLAIATATLAWVPSITLVLTATALIAIFMQFYFGPLFAIPIHVFGARTAGISTGFSNLCANVGAFTLVYAMGALKDVTGSFSAGLYLLSGLCVVGLVCSLALARPGMLAPVTLTRATPA